MQRRTALVVPPMSVMGLYAVCDMPRIGNQVSQDIGCWETYCLLEWWSWMLELYLGLG